MRSEILKYKGQLAELKRKYNHLDTEASGLIIHIRSLLDPFEEDVTKLKVEIVANSAERLSKVVEEIRHLQSRIKELEEAIG